MWVTTAMCRARFKRRSPPRLIRWRTVFPEEAGIGFTPLVASSSGPARKYYVPTTYGAAELARSTRAWLQLTMTVTATLGRVGAGPARDDALTVPTQEEPA